MALPSEATTRIDQLAADLRRAAEARRALAAEPNTQPLFIQHADGSVYDRHGRELRGPTVGKP